MISNEILLFCFISEIQINIFVLFSKKDEYDIKRPYIMGKTSRDRDKGRKYLSGNQRRALAKAKEAENEKHRGAINKFLVTPSLKRPRIENEENNSNSENDVTMNPITVDQYNLDINGKLEKNDTAVNKIEDNLNSSQDSSNTESIIITGKKQAQASYNDVSSISTAVNIMNDDPANWPTAMNNNARDYLAIKGPPNIPGNSFPRNGKGSCFSKFHCKRKLLNGESVERPWIIYSKSADKIYCFYCKLFIKNASTALSTSGFNNWSNVHTRLCEHEKSKNHMKATCSYWELHQRLCSGQLIKSTKKSSMSKQSTGSKYSKG